MNEVSVATEQCDIAIVISDMGSGGAQRVISLLAEHWVACGRSVHVLTMESEDKDFFQLSTSVKRHVTGGIGDSRHIIEAIFSNVRRVWNIRRTLQEIKPQVVISFIGVTNILTILASYGQDWKLVISERNDPALQSLGRAHDLLRKYLYRFADCVTANSTTAMNTLKAYVPESRLSSVQNPIVLPEPVSDEKEEPMVLSVGRLTHQKAHDVTIRAVALIDPDLGLSFKILGEGELRDELSNLIGDLGIADRIMLQGRVEDVNSWYERASIFVLVSRYEGMPNALLEAMAHGKAVIVSDQCGAAKELVEDGISGLVVPVEDEEALSRAITRLWKDVKLRKQLGVNARKKVAHLSADSVFNPWEAIIDSNE